MSNSNAKQPSAAKDPQQELRRKTLLAALVLALPFLGVMYLIFGGGESPSAPGQNALNTSVPEGRSAGIEASKQRALERVAAESQQSERARLFDQEDFSLLATPSASPQPAAGDALRRSQQAHLEATQAMSGFYAAPPAPDPQVAELQRQVQQLQQQLDARNTAPDPLELAEKQYALAAKYLHGEPPPEPGAAATAASVEAQPVRGMQASVVSSLAPPLSDSASVAVRERLAGFNTPVGGAVAAARTGIRVCVDEDQVIVSGGRVRLRLQDPIRVAGHMVPAGSILYGEATIGGQRMKIHVSSLHLGSEVLPVALDAYDLDGGEGLYVPDSEERTALKDAAAAIGSSFGNSISFTRGAGQQVAMDLARGTMTGGTQYLASKLRQVKVTVKAGYQIILVSKE